MISNVLVRFTLEVKNYVPDRNVLIFMICDSQKIFVHKHTLHLQCFLFNRRELLNIGLSKSFILIHDYIREVTMFQPDLETLPETVVLDSSLCLFSLIFSFFKEGHIMMNSLRCKNDL